MRKQTMAALAIDVSTEINKTMEERADARLEEWAKWFGRGRPVGPAEPSCTLGRIKDQRVAAGQSGAPPEIPAAADEVERAVLRMSYRVRRLIETFYCEYSTMDQKAKDCGLTRSGYWRALGRAKRAIYGELY
jgi:hypothetical protein